MTSTAIRVHQEAGAVLAQFAIYCFFGNDETVALLLRSALALKYPIRPPGTQ